MKKKELLEENENLRINIDNLCMGEITLERRIKELEKENEKLKQKLADCIMSNELLDREIERLKQSETEAKEIIAELESKLAEYEKFGLDKDLKELEKLK